MQQDDQGYSIINILFLITKNFKKIFPKYTTDIKR